MLNDINNIYAIQENIDTSNPGGLDNLAPGTYYLLITDSNGCQNNPLEEFIVTEPTEIQISAEYSSYWDTNYGISCPDYDDGWIDTYVVGGVGDYVYDWDFIENEFDENVELISEGSSVN